MLKRDFTDEQALFRDIYRKFLNSEIVPHLEVWREAGIVDRSAFSKAGERGLLMIWPDEKYGGQGDADFRFEQIIIEETTCARAGDWYNSLHSRVVGRYLSRFGNEEQRLRFLPKCVSGECILAIAMTEPDAGSDLAGIRTRAIPDGSDWILTGAKTYISNGINSDLVIVAAKTGTAAEPRHVTLFLVERGMAGFSRGRLLKKMGLKAQDTAELFFDSVRVPGANVLGEPGRGLQYLAESLTEERLACAASFIAGAQLSWHLTASFVQQRKVFGSSVASFQNTQFKLAEMRAEIDMAQVYVDRCVQAFNAGELSAVDAAQAKLITSELHVRMAGLGVQLHGGAGYMDESPISRQYTDARIATIFGGSSEIMKLIIGRHCLSDQYVPFHSMGL